MPINEAVAVKHTICIVLFFLTTTYLTPQTTPATDGEHSPTGAWRNSIGMGFVLGSETFRIMMQTTEVTRKQWDAVMEGSLADQRFDQQSYLSSRRFRENANPDHPMTPINWYDAVVFCNRLSLKEYLTPVYSIEGITDPDYWGEVPCYDVSAGERGGESTAVWDSLEKDPEAGGYRLPTRAEWEEAARGSVFSRGHRYAGSNDLDEVAWWSGDGVGSLGGVQPAGLKQPNELGLYDMNGNVWEWCWDEEGTGTGGETYDAAREVVRTPRVIRGGSWINTDPELFVIEDAVGSLDPKKRYDTVGFRVVRNHWIRVPGGGGYCAHAKVRRIFQFQQCGLCSGCCGYFFY